MAASKQTLLDTIHRYVELVATGSSADVVALYADGATVEDPVGSEVRTTRESIAEFYAALDGLEQEARVLHARVAGNEAAFAFELVTIVGEKKLTLAPVDVMTFDDEGRITSMRAFWSEDDMVWS
ncbi:nuclear transport factor 2 family protein [Nocardioides sp. zg-536]|uniref:Nuclear transport factor 2 family protein n=1 Tax=Nocardioides faecalis TaxID=2803858 RepID=A0A939BU54_9ACTN|nr:nuclear transport factor 2 family protein [Nocardioides faecalis]MBM9458501.1 nuclear transport factor 2 family protein [Nocardioides faecalis]MBS4752832.1 nuclear transport factor 2 family protein [Nocardioides faecalis]QVI58511.1 nuclear transport factor 2 family protein [Nocardioides faecalis]